MHAPGQKRTVRNATTSTQARQHELTSDRLQTSSMASNAMDDAFLVRQHIMFAYRCVRFLPTPYQPEDSNR